MSCSLHADIMLAARLGIPLMAALTAALGKPISNPSGVVMIFLSVAPLLASMTTIATGGFAIALW